jgi:hypothetical protein
VKEREMKRTLFQIIIVVMLLVGLLAPVTVGTVEAQETTGVIVSDVPGQSIRTLTSPRTDGKTVVWLYKNQSPVDTSARAYMADLATLVPVEITEDAVYWIDIDDGVIVWSAAPQDQISGPAVPFGVFAWDLNRDEQFDLSTPGGDVMPAISDGLVVWRGLERDPLTAATVGERILAQHLGSEEPAVVATIEDGWTAEAPKVDRDRIVWRESRQASEEGWLWRLWIASFGEEPVLLDEGLVEPLDYSNLRIYDIGGDHVVYLGNDEGLTVFNVVTRESTTLLTGSLHLAVDGRYVYSVTSWNEITAFDLSTSSFFTAPNFLQDVDPSLEYIGDISANAGVVLWAWRMYGGIGGSEIRYASSRDLLPSASQPDPGKTDPAWLYFDKTGHYLSYGFRDFWLNSGGLPVFGYPLTREYDELNHDLDEFRTVQYTERQRFEYHPEYAGTPYETLLGRLGAADADRRGLNDHEAFQRVGQPSSAGVEYFAATAHTLRGPFRDYWHSHGLEFGDAGISYRESLALFGYPISEEFVDPDTGLTTQYFERAVFEYHPDNPDPYKVLLRLLGAEEIERRGW